MVPGSISRDSSRLKGRGEGRYPVTANDERSADSVRDPGIQPATRIQDAILTQYTLWYNRNSRNTSKL